MPELSQTENNQPQTNPQSFFGIVSGGTAQAGTSFLVVPDTTKVNDLYLGQILHFKSLSKLESPDVSEFVLTQLGIYHATSLIRILDEAVYYPKVQNHIMSIIVPYIEAHQEVVFDMLPAIPKEVIDSNSGDENAELTDSEVQNMSFFRFLEELDSGAYTTDDIEEDE